MKIWKKHPNLDEEYMLINSVTSQMYLSKACYKHYFTQEKNTWTSLILKVLCPRETSKENTVLLNLISRHGYKSIVNSSSN